MSANEAPYSKCGVLRDPMSECYRSVIISRSRAGQLQDDSELRLLKPRASSIKSVRYPRFFPVPITQSLFTDWGVSPI